LVHRIDLALGCHVFDFPNMRESAPAHPISG